ncbi:MAG TPA: hypothetical protein VGH60_03305 [Solirubrobacteraceae bacterium]|jgi:hypothetical protein
MAQAQALDNGLDALAVAVAVVRKRVTAPATPSAQSCFNVEMSRRGRAGALALLLAALLGGGDAIAGANLVSVRLPTSSSATTGKLKVRLRPNMSLPRGGFYYAVLVLVDYKLGAPGEQPMCAVSSDMRETQYISPRNGRTGRLILLPAPSADRRWCHGTYEGAIYAVPHKPRCTHHDCYGTAAGGPCWELEGKTACGVVANPKAQEEREAKERAEREQKEREAREQTEAAAKAKAEREAAELAKREAERAQQTTYSYPGGLPHPIDGSARIVARFTVTFK